jgi:nitrogen fixation protein NifX
MRVAVTTDDLERVDASFGLARHIAVYEVSHRSTRLVETHRFPGRNPGCDGASLGHRAAALKNCAVLYTLEIGVRGAERAAAAGVRVIEVLRTRGVAEVLTALQANLAARRPWFRRSWFVCPERPPAT